MSAYLSKDLLASVGASRIPKPRSDAQLAVVSNNRRLPVRRRWSTGFSVDASDARHLRGLVELYEGDALLGWCLVYSGTLDGAEHRFEFKRFTACGDAPPVDFERIPPVVLQLAAPKIARR
ncbi:hypothetical protein ILP92_12785 [Maribius pontilimi]|uniref:Uncharacterized protein n=1 Tax=Palleronia pontilimi TaxID=1964209 RepID=A0A934IJC8_9RHOB|nr:hypothetical protein [Palleronia pontilimi]MBJ3763625.1 hypothetical protein [Palleronia pontilimi]